MAQFPGQSRTKRTKAETTQIKQKVIQGLSQGKTIRAISAEINIPRETVHEHSKAYAQEIEEYLREQRLTILSGFITRTIGRIKSYDDYLKKYPSDIRVKRDQQFCDNSLIKVMSDTGYLPKAVQEIFLHTDKESEEPLMKAQQEMKDILMNALKQKMEAKNASIVSKSNNSKAPETATGKT